MADEEEEKREIPSSTSSENLDLSFDDLHVEDLLEQRSSDTASVHKPNNNLQSNHNGDVCCSDETHEDDEDYILGTLIVRVVAARDLQSVGGSGIGKLLFGDDRRSNNKKHPSANPYASVRFGSTTQRTSEVYGTIDPTWPRGESMYMDVLHPGTTSLRENEANESSSHHRSSKLSLNDGKKSVASLKSDPSDFRKIKSVGSHESKKAEHGESSTSSPLTQPILTVAVFHAADAGKTAKFPSKGPMAGDSDDRFLGMTAVDLTVLLTGKIRTFDEWLPLSGSSADRAAVRIVCEYEPSDGQPQPGDMVRFTDFCHPADLYPFHCGKLYRVEECTGDDVVISYTSPEGWVSSGLAHRYMLMCEARFQRPVDIYQDELASLQHRIAHSPMVDVVQETLQRLPDEGLVGVSVDAVRGGASLLTRWIEGGLGTAVGDLAFATNWDGRFNPDAATTLSTASLEDEEAEELEPSQEQHRRPSSSTEEGDDEVDISTIEALPNMPSCPITGEPMRDPVVAADGHTYERTAIARWLRTSNKSPLTGSILPHKNLVPNYMLLSSLSDAATTSTTKPPPPSPEDPPQPPLELVTVEPTMEEEEGITTEVNIDD